MAINYTDEFNPYDSDLPAQEPNPAPVQPPPTGAAPPPEATATQQQGGDLPVGSLTTDPNIIRQHVLRWGAMAGADPSLTSDPDYWVRRIIETGGLGHQNAQYWMDAGVGPNAFFRNPNREGGSAGGGGNLQNDTRAVEDWWSANAPSMDQFTNLARPDYLSGPYTPAVWNEKFIAPTADELLSDPGFLASEAATQRGLERSAAAKGSILSGGFVGRTLPRAMAENAGQAYQNLYGRRLGEYRDRKNDFDIANNVSMAARGINEGQFQSDLQNNLNQFNTRYKAYRDTIGDSFDLSRLGLQAALGTRY